MRRNITKRALLVFAGCMSAVLMACGKEESVSINNETVSKNEQIVVSHDVDTVDKAIDRILNDEYYSRDEVISRDVRSLTELDEAEGKRWLEITDYWAEINKTDFVNMEELPDNLPQDNSFCIVVMGYCLNTDGTMRDELIGRLETAKRAAEKYENAYILVSGGGTASENPSATEADSMAQWLIENGINEERIIIENRSLTSATNAVYSYEILSRDYKSVNSIAIVTSEYHVPLGCVLYNTQFILKDSDIRVISNAAYISGNSSSFNKKSQVDWIRRLLEAQE